MLKLRKKPVLYGIKAKRLNFQKILNLSKDTCTGEDRFYYQLKQLPSIFLVDFLNFVSRRLLGKFRKELKFLVIDGTGFKYNEIYPLKVLIGKGIKKVKSHVKVVVLSFHLKGRKRFILTALPGESYSSEVIRWLNKRGFIRKALKGKPFLGDKAYDSIKFIELMLLTGLKLYIKMKKKIRKGIKPRLGL